jgi:hypothetical protein
VLVAWPLPPFDPERLMPGAALEMEMALTRSSNSDRLLEPLLSLPPMLPLPPLPTLPPELRRWSIVDCEP